MSKKKKYNEKFIEFYNNNDDKTITHAVKKFCKINDISYNDNIRRKYSNVLSREGITRKNNLIEKCDDFKIAKNKNISKSKYYLITSAQNATRVHKKFFDNIIAYRKKLDAELVVIATRYNNFTKVSQDKKNNRWDNLVKPYLSANRHNVHANLQILADIKINPTASTPLSGLNGISGLESCVIGHPRLHMKMLPVLEGYPHKILMTTGMCTIENYTDSKAGKKGEFHHNLGFVIVEVKDDKTFFIRQVAANDNGSFYDINNYVKKGKVQTSTKRTDVIVFGDVHLGEHDEIAMKTSFDMVDRFNPRYIILHDLFSGYSINPHEKNDAFVLLNRKKNNKLSLKEELLNIYKFLNDAPKNVKYVVVRSNHDEFLDRFLINSDWKKEQNKSEYLELAYIKSQGIANDGLLPYLIQQNTKNVITLGINESFAIHGREFGIHGHNGSGGSRGSAVQFKNLNVKNVTGHTHTPIRLDGHASVGTLSKLRMGYNNGMSNWSHANIIQQPDGNIQHLIIINGEYTTFNN